ncbi:arylsulfatase [Simiduia agarivorans]|uniref:Sulfatase n=1 Tax=Simiduia agarivorans (strain DSM 21679 / JCM 13881 / BCRC 17597 / SA1) TaxID=1117647 RepID=K4KQ63_SIMAS|nr:arylsulfatase [Simiduia agarivorans]AFV00254.1 sulfatase [Simiduia agarivorans SA1 = DSM 21679]
MQRSLLRRLNWLGASLLVALSISCTAAEESNAGPKPNILVIWGDDIGTWNISHNNRGMMGYHTPNIDRIANEGLSFTDYYAQQSCTAGRAAFIGGSVPVRSGMTKVGLPGAKEGWPASAVTMASVMKELGYATGQFGKNHQGDRDEHLPTMHGFDEFFGNLYHLNAEEEPENRDYPGDMVLANGKTFKQQFGPRGVMHSWADGKGGQKVKDTGPLTKKRMETIDDESSKRAMEFIREQHKAGKPWFVWWNGTRMHFRTHVKEEHRGISGQDEYSDGMVEHDLHIGQFLKLLDELKIADNTLVMYSTDNGPHYNTWPDAGTTPFRGEKNSNWEGAYRVPTFVRWPGKFPAGKTLNGIVSHEDWLTTFAAAAGDTTVKQRLLKGTKINGRTYKAHLDGYNQLDYLTGKVKESPRHEFWYVNDDGQVVAARYDDWKVVFLENRGQRFGVWREPFVELRVPLLFNLRRDPFEKSQHNSNTYEDWFLDRPYVIVPIQGLAAKFLQSMKEYPPAQTPGSFNLSKIEEQLRSNMGSN